MAAKMICGIFFFFRKPLWLRSPISTAWLPHITFTSLLFYLSNAESKALHVPLSMRKDVCSTCLTDIRHGMAHLHFSSLAALVCYAATRLNLARDEQHLAPLSQLAAKVWGVLLVCRPACWGASRQPSQVCSSDISFRRRAVVYDLMSFLWKIGHIIHTSTSWLWSERQ